MRKVKDRTGVRYGKLTALEFTSRVHPRRGAIWKCKCDCGSLLEVPAFFLQVGHKKSCGCLIKDIGVAKRLVKGKAGLNKVVYNMKKRAKESGREYNLSEEYVIELTQRNCFYCDGEPKSVSKHSKGYVNDNVVPCCEECNKIKGAYLSSDEMVEVAKLLKKLRN